ncbi:MAG: hypothetical protein P8Z40_14110 [Chloroflexota bacterium]
MADLDNHEKEEEYEIVDGEVIAEFHSETLMNLPVVPGDDDYPAPPEGFSGDEYYDGGRRNFMTRLLIGGVAALALGGGAAIIYRNSQQREPTVVILPNGSEMSVDDPEVDVGALFDRIADLEYQLAAVTADRDQLISDLAEGSSDLEVLRSRIESLQNQLTDERSLNDLWQALDDVGLDSLLNSALQVVVGALAGVTNIATLLRSGLQRGQDALDSFVAKLPGPQDGIRWLGQQVNGLAVLLDWLKEQVQEAVEPVEPFTSMIAQFVLWVLDRLPFGAGNQARAGMEAMQDVINSLPDMVSGINTTVLDPLADWFGDNERVNVFGILLNPITDNVIQRAEDLLDEVAGFEASYNTQLSNPVTDVLEERALIKAQIQALQVRLGRLA